MKIEYFVKIDKSNGERFKAARKKHKVTQVEAAKLLKLSQGQISKIETGHNYAFLPVATVRRVAPGFFRAARLE